MKRIIPLIFILFFTSISFARIICHVGLVPYYDNEGNIQWRVNTIYSCWVVTFVDNTGGGGTTVSTGGGNTNEDPDDEGCSSDLLPKTQLFSQIDNAGIHQEALEIDEQYPNFEIFLKSTIKDKRQFLIKEGKGKQTITIESNMPYALDVFDINFFLSNNLDNQYFQQKIKSRLILLEFPEEKIASLFDSPIHSGETMMEYLNQEIPKKLFFSPRFQLLLKSSEYYKDPAFTKSEDKAYKYYLSLGSDGRREWDLAKREVEQQAHYDLFEMFTSEYTMIQKAILYICLQKEYQSKFKSIHFRRN